MIWQAVLLWRTRSEVHRQADWMETQAAHMASQVGVMQQQLDEMKAGSKTAREAADAAKLSAEAALAQTQAMKDHAVIMKRQASILRASVEIAERSAKAFVNSERARISLIFTETERLVYRCQAKNSGRSPALILGFLVEFRVLTSDETLPWLPDYVDREYDHSSTGEKWVIPGEIAELEINDAFEFIDLSETSPQLSNETRKALQEHAAEAVFYGFVHYRDSISDDDRITRFRYSCLYVGDSYLFLPERDGPYCLET
jgi:hypothetical protein